MKATAPQTAGELPPGPELAPARQTARIAMRPLAFLEELRENFGEIFTIRALDESPWVMVSDPALIAEVFKAPGEVLHAGEVKKILAPVLGTSSLLLLDEGAHMEHRKLLLPPFGPGSIPGYEAATLEAAERAIEAWPAGHAQPAIPRTRAIALEVILHTVFGAGDSEWLASLREALGDLRLPGNDRAGWTREFRLLVDRIDELVFAEIATRAGEPEIANRSDVLARLVQARHEDGEPMSSLEIRDELMTLLVAGYETTATTLAWALERLARNPGALAAVEAEAAGGGGPYTEAAIRETLRVRPALPTVARAVVEPFELDGHLLPPGTTIMPAILLLHHRPDIYPEPHAFRPERFLENPPDPNAWLPFGGGVRRCIGARFALQEMRIVLSALLRRMRVRAVTTEPEAMRRRDITLTPARGAPLILEPR